MTEPSPAQVSGRWDQTEPHPTTDVPSEKPLEAVGALLTVELRCLSAEAAEEVVERCREAPHAGPHNRARQEGDVVVITYVDKLWPYDIADMANELKLASDHDVEMLFVRI